MPAVERRPAEDPGEGLPRDGERLSRDRGEVLSEPKRKPDKVQTPVPEGEGTARAAQVGEANRAEGEGRGNAEGRHGREGEEREVVDGLRDVLRVLKHSFSSNTSIQQIIYFFDFAWLIELYFRKVLSIICRLSRGRLVIIMYLLCIRHFLGSFVKLILFDIFLTLVKH